MNSRLNYSTWKKDNKSILSSLSDKKVFMTYSGGKDSSVSLHFIQKAVKEFGFDFETHSAVFPHHVFRDIEKKKLDFYWRARGISITWHEVPETDEYLDNALYQGLNPCLICNHTKKKLLINYFKKLTPDLEALVIIMSYSLWDLVSATIEHILSAIYFNTNCSVPVRGKGTEERFIETSQRFYPSLKLKEGLTIFKPLIRYNDQDILKVISDNKIPLLTTSCNYKEYRPKRLFGTYYKKMGLHFEYSKVLEFAKKSLNLPEISYYSNISMEEYLTKII
jgi:tRNA(Ile)-lysidine synthase TilS/MesJ